MMQFLSNTDRVLIFCPHPDDDVLAAGGLLQQLGDKQIEVRIIFLTDGESNPWPQRVIERRLALNDADRRRWGARRRSEALAGLKILGIDQRHTVFLGLPDQGITSLLLTSASSVIDKIAHILLDWQPTLIIAPASFDLHPDHNALAVLLHWSIQSYVAKTRPLPSPRQMYFLIHPDKAPRGQHLSVTLSPEQLDKKKTALMQHISQMKLSSQRFLKYARQQEHFHLEPFPEAENTCHPVKAAYHANGCLCVVLAQPRMIDKIIRPTLHLLVGTEQKHSLSIRLDFLHPGTMASDHPRESGRFLHGQLCKIRNYWILRLPDAELGNTGEVFAKLDNKLGFLDHSGWKRLLLPSMNGGVVEHPKPYARSIALIPCFNVANFCRDVVRRSLLQADRVIVVDDGSTDGTAMVLQELKNQAQGRIEVITNAVNAGKGNALIKGMRHALDNYRFAALVTLDGDGQHHPEDIQKAVQVICEGSDFVIGQRNFSQMPLRSRFGNSLTTYLFRKLYPLGPQDTQSGFRAFSPEFISEILMHIDHGRYETELYMLLLALNIHMKIGVFQIDTIYIDKNASSHFRPVTDSMHIMSALLRWQLGMVKHSL